MAAPGEVLSKIESEGNNYYLLVKFNNDGSDALYVTLTNGENVWSANVSREDVQEMADNVDMDVGDYMQQSFKALTGQRGADSFVFHTSPQGENLKFSWKKQLGDGVKFQLGSLELSIDKSSTVNNKMFDFAVREIEILKEEILSLRSENGRLSDERRKAMKLLEKCTTAKEEMEDELYHKFAEVLNAKKAKIRQLKSKAQYVDESHADATDNVAATGPSKTARRRRQMSTSSEEESTGSPEQPSSPQPDTSTAPVDASPLLLEEDLEPILPAAKRRRRREPKVISTPTSKVVLPKVSSVKKTPSTSSEDSMATPRLRKKLSQRSDIDADDLMAEMEL